MKKRPGFTTLELLIVLAVFGILASIAAFTINQSREALRDADRVSDVTVLRSALSQYWLRHASYPTAEGVSLGSPESGIRGFTTEGFVTESGSGNVILEFIPTGPRRNEYYLYTSDGIGYSLRFTTERATVFGDAGTYYAHSGGVDVDETVK